jgi:hypothetical protein
MHRIPFFVVGGADVTLHKKAAAACTKYISRAVNINTMERTASIG